MPGNQRIAMTWLRIDSRALALDIRAHSLNMVHLAKASHIGSALSIADILAVLYANVMNYKPHAPRDDQRDRFILSKGHACVAVYGALAALGFFPKEQLKTYGQDGSDLMNHISHKLPGVEFSTGALGHGLSFGVGKALAAKRTKACWRVFVLLSDGELDEGSNWEAMMFAAHHRLEQLFILIDYNRLQSLDTVANTLGLEPLRAKFESFGLEVRESDGHDHVSLTQAFKPSATGAPVVLICHTTKGKGVSFMENRVEWHYKNPNAEQLEKALAELVAS
jgi:transketolase